MTEEGMRAIAGRYGALYKTLTTAEQAEWVEVLGELPDELLLAAFQAHVTDPDVGQFPANPARLVGRARDILVRAGHILGPQAAWQEALRVGRRYARETRPQPSTDNPLVMRAVELLGGAALIGLTHPAALRELREDFKGHYDTLTRDVAVLTAAARQPPLPPTTILGLELPDPDRFPEVRAVTQATRTRQGDPALPPGGRFLPDPNGLIGVSVYGKGDDDGQG